MSKLLQKCILVTGVVVSFLGWPNTAYSSATTIQPPDQYADDSTMTSSGDEPPFLEQAETTMPQTASLTNATKSPTSVTTHLSTTASPQTTTITLLSTTTSPLTTTTSPTTVTTPLTTTTTPLTTMITTTTPLITTTTPLTTTTASLTPTKSSTLEFNPMPSVTNSATNSASQQSQGAIVGALAGGVVGCLAGVALIALGIVFLIRRRRLSSEKLPELPVTHYDKINLYEAMRMG